MLLAQFRRRLSTAHRRRISRALQGKTVGKRVPAGRSRSSGYQSAKKIYIKNARTGAILRSRVAFNPQAKRFLLEKPRQLNRVQRAALRVGLRP